MGGAEHLLLRLITGLPPEISPILVCGNPGQFPETARARQVNTTVLQVPKFISTSFVIRQRKIFNPLALVVNAFLVLNVAWELRQFLRASGADLVQTNTTFSHIYGGLAARFAGLPVVWYFHDLVELGAWVAAFRCSGSYWRGCAPRRSWQCRRRCGMRSRSERS